MGQTYLDKIHGPADLRGLKVEELEALAGEIRQLIKTTVSRNGGHLASNLGVVELTLALHRAFDFARDRLVWDVGHQCYVHKILTGRARRFSTLRQGKGLSGFPAPEESPYDQFAVGHAGTAVATAVGLALGAQKQARSEKVVAVVGDASIVNGVSFEGLNNTHLVKRQLLVILNDNSMAIDKTEGAFANYLARLRISRPYEDLRRRTHILTRRLPLFGEAIQETLDRLKEGLKTTLQHRQIFEQLGIPYFGPVDGHDLGSLIRLLEVIRDIDHPVLLHVQTEKGRGFVPAQEDPCRFHSPPPFKVNGDSAFFGDRQTRTFTCAFAEALAAEMEKDERIVALTAAMPDGTGLAQVRRKFPERVLDVGIAESAAVDMAAGLAKTGLRPVVAVYSTFLQRAFDQVFQEVSLQNLPVVFCLDRAGLVGGDGAVHHGFCDIALLRTLPHLVLLAPLDERELRAALGWALRSGEPCVLRYPRDATPPAEITGTWPKVPYERGKARRLRRGRDVILLTYGSVGYQAWLAAEQLAGEGIEVGLVDARFAKPLDAMMLREVFEASDTAPVITVEDHALTGGFGSAVLEQVVALGLPVQRVMRLGLPDTFVPHDSRAAQLAQVGLDVTGLTASIRQVLRHTRKQPKAGSRPAGRRPPPPRRCGTGPDGPVRPDRSVRSTPA